MSTQEAVDSEFSALAPVTVPAGERLFHQGDPCDNYAILLEGTVRVFARSAAGREVVLYRVHPGEVCVLTTSCLLANRSYPAEAVAETDVSLKLLPRNRFDELMETSPRFRRFVFTSFSNRLANLIDVVQQVALESIEHRLLKILLIHCDDDNRLAMTHQQLATEIGSVREVVSRHLKQFERRGWLHTDRGAIQLLDKPAMQQSLTVS